MARILSDDSNLLHSWSFFKNFKENILSSILIEKLNLLILGTSDTNKLILVDTSDNYKIIADYRITNVEDTTDSFASVLCMESYADKYLFVGCSDSLIRIYKVTNTSLQLLNTVYSTMDVGDILSLKYLEQYDTLVIGTQRCCLLYVTDILESKKINNTLKEINSGESAIADENDHISRLPSKRYDKFFDSFGPTGNKSTVSTRSLSNATQDDVTFQSMNIIQVPQENIINFAHNGFIYCMDTYTDTTDFNSPKQYLITSAGDGLTKRWIMDIDTKVLHLKNVIDINDDITGYGFSDDEEEKENDAVISQFIKYPLLFQGISEMRINVISLLTDRLIETIDLNEVNDSNEVVANGESLLHAIKASSINDSILFIAANDNVYQYNLEGFGSSKGDENAELLDHKVVKRRGSLVPDVKIKHFIRFIRSQIKNQILNICVDGNKLAVFESDGTVYLFDLSDVLIPESESPALNEAELVAISKENNVLTDNDLYHKSEILIKDLSKLISFKTTAENKQQIHACASYLQSLLNRLHANVEVFPNSINGTPIIKATFAANSKSIQNTRNKKNVLIYAHYDVVPSSESDNEFQLFVKDGFLQGRGVSDNKGPIISMIHGISELAEAQNLKNNVVFIFEGCEESGSVGFEETLKSNPKLTQSVDYIIMANSYWIGNKYPCLNYGMRGVLNLEISVEGIRDLHSGTDGGIFSETTKDLMFLISNLIDYRKNTLNVPGFVEDLNNQELCKNEINFFNDIIATGEGGVSLETLINKWTKPSFSITSMNGSSEKSIVPKEANITLSIRTVPTQKSVSILKNLIIEKIKKDFDSLNSSNKLKFEVLNEAEPWLGDFNDRIYKIASEELKSIWKNKVLLIREGGSIPTLKILERMHPTAKIMILPNGQASDNAHLQGEKFRLENFFNLKTSVKNIVNRL